MATDKDISQTLYFVYLGTVLPTYAKASLILAKKHSGMAVHLIGNKVIGETLGSSLCEFTAVEDFYTGDGFNIAKSNIKSDARYRGGFWVKTLERFFVLYEFAKFRGLRSIFHAELDQLLFGTDELVKNIEQHNLSGIFVPFHSPELAVASVFYCNHLDALSSLLLEAMSGEAYGNEMALIAQWASKNRNLAVSLPTAASLLKNTNVATPQGVHELTPKDLGGIVDAAQLGMWVAGIDPKNVPLTELPRTKFVNEPVAHLLSKSELESIKFTMSKNTETLLTACSNNQSIRIFNLHIHAKIHQSISSGQLQLDCLFKQTNEDKRRILKASLRPWLWHHAKHYTYALFTKPHKIIPVLGRISNNFWRKTVNKGWLRR